MAECHPVAFRWVIQAKTRPTNPAQVIHADPRFTRTSALADDLRAAAGRQRHRLPRGADPARRSSGSSRSSSKARRPAHAARAVLPRLPVCTTRTPPTLLTEDFTRHRGRPAGLFTGFDAGSAAYDLTKWRYDNGTTDGRLKPARITSDDRGGLPPSKGDAEGKPFAAGRASEVGPAAGEDRPDAARPDAASSRSCAATSPATRPELVEEVCGTPRETFLKVAEALLGELRARTGPAAICYAVGWTQHTTGVQMIRAAAILQLLLGNVGRPGGGILALRGHATIQGSTDIATLYNLLPGYLNDPERPAATTSTSPSTSRTETSARRRTGRTSRRSSSASSRRGSATRRRRRTTSASTGCRRSSATTRTCRCSWT